MLSTIYEISKLHDLKVMKIWLNYSGEVSSLWSSPVVERAENCNQLCVLRDVQLLARKESSLSLTLYRSPSRSFSHRERRNGQIKEDEKLVEKFTTLKNFKCISKQIKIQFIFLFVVSSSRLRMLLLSVLYYDDIAWNTLLVKNSSEFQFNQFEIK